MEIPQHTQELRDLLEKPQGKATMWLFWFLVGILAFFTTLGATVKTPDVLPARAIVYPVRPPVEIKAQSSGRIQATMLIPGPVQRGDWLAYIENAADPYAVGTLDSTIKELTLSVQIPDSLLALGPLLGDISQSFNAFVETGTQYRILMSDENEYSFSARQHKQREQMDLEDIPHMKSSCDVYREQYDIRKRQAATDSILYSQGAILRDEWESSRMSALNARQNLITAENALRAKLRSANENNHAYEDDIRNLSESRIIQTTKFRAASANLHAQISSWKERYIFKAPSDGNVEWSGTVLDGDFVSAGTSVFVITQKGNSYYAIAALPGEGAGKTEVGQHVRIRLDAYPYAEYGYLEGTVEMISVSSADGRYTIKIILPKGNISSAGKSLSFAETLYGTAEIVTNRRTVISRIYSQLHDILTKRAEPPIPNQDENIQAQMPKKLI